MPQQTDLDGLVHHWQQGPADVHRYRCNKWKFYWYLDSIVPLPGQIVTRRQILSTLYAVINHPLSWERSGVQFVRTHFKSRANILIRFGPQNDSACGPGSAGCYWWDSQAQKPIAYMGIEYLNNPSVMAELINMELMGHGCFRMWDMYTSEHQPYPGGVMGTWEDSRKTDYFPSELEIVSAKAWLLGLAKHVHWH